MPNMVLTNRFTEARDTKFTPEDAGVVCAWLNIHGYTGVIRRLFMQKDGEIVIDVYRTQQGQETGFTENTIHTDGVESLGSLYSRWYVDAFAKSHDLPLCQFSEDVTAALDEILAEANTPAQPNRSDPLTPELVAKYLKELSAPNEDVRFTVGVAYCCDYLGYDHFNLTITNDEGVEHRMVCVGDVEDFLHPPAIRIDVTAQYDGINDYYTFPFAGDFIRQGGFTRGGIATGLATWTLEEIRECHGRVNDEKRNRFFILNPPENLFDWREEDVVEDDYDAEGEYEYGDLYE